MRVTYPGKTLLFTFRKYNSHIPPLSEIHHIPSPFMG